MFQFPGCPPMRLWIHLMVTGHYPRRVSPFGYPRLNACLRLPEAFRSLPRPSSAISAMASTLRSCSLDFFRCASPASVKLRRFFILRPTAKLSSILRSYSLCSFQGAGCFSIWLFRFLQNDSSFDPFETTGSVFEEQRTRQTGRNFFANTASLTIDLRILRSRFSSRFLPRKEVIQPHLPIRLPCYDFTPVIGLTFDSCSLERR